MSNSISINSIIQHNEMIRKRNIHGLIFVLDISEHYYNDICSLYQWYFWVRTEQGLYKQPCHSFIYILTPEIFITSVTGCGKIYIACAFGMDTYRKNIVSAVSCNAVQTTCNNQFGFYIWYVNWRDIFSLWNVSSHFWF